MFHATWDIINEMCLLAGDDPCRSEAAQMDPKKIVSLAGPRIQAEVTVEMFDLKVYPQCQLVGFARHLKNMLTTCVSKKLKS